MRKLFFVLSALFCSLSLFAQDGGGMSENAHLAYAAALTITIAAVGGALSQGKAASVALDGIARNPGAADKLFTPMIIALALIESLVIYAFVISFLIKP